MIQLDLHTTGTDLTLSLTTYQPGDPVRTNHMSIVSVCGCEKSGDEIFDATQLGSLFTLTKQSTDDVIATPTILYISTGPDASVTIFNSAGKTFVIGTILFQKSSMQHFLNWC